MTSDFLKVSGRNLSLAEISVLKLKLRQIGLEIVNEEIKSAQDRW